MGKPAMLRPMPNHALGALAASYGIARREPEERALGARGEDEPPPPKNRTREEARRRRQAARLNAKKKGAST